MREVLLAIARTHARRAGRNRARALLQEEYKEAKRKETTARRGVKISVIPMLLYFLFICAACFYVYTRVRFGMGGLQSGLRSYSFFVLFVEILGMINMLFYGCWLFAKPVNSDVFPEPDEFVRPMLAGLAERAACLFDSSEGGL